MKRLLAVIFVLVGLGLVAVAGVSYWVSSTINTPKEHTHGADYIKIEKGSTPRQIVDQLAEAGILPSPTATMLYLRTIGDGSKLQAGEYQFASPISPLQVLKQLEKG